MRRRDVGSVALGRAAAAKQQHGHIDQNEPIDILRHRWRPDGRRLRLRLRHAQLQARLPRGRHCRDGTGTDAEGGCIVMYCCSAVLL